MSDPNELTISDALRNSPFPVGSTVRSAVTDLDSLFDSRVSRLIKIRDMYDRKPPFDPEKLREAGQSYRANVNTGEMESMVDDETAEATLSMMTASPIASLRAPGVPLSTRKKLSIAFHDFLHESESFSLFHFVDRINFENNAYGYGVATFPSGPDWRPRWQPHFEVRFDEDATTDVKDHNVFAVHTREPLVDLFEALDFDPEAVANDWHRGWNVPELRRFLAQQSIGVVSDDGHRHFTNVYLEAAQALRDGTGWATGRTRFKKVRLTHVYARHPKTGKVCHYIISTESPEKKDTDNGSHIRSDSQPEAMRDSQVLYYKDNEFDSMEECLWLVSYNFGPSTLASVRGLAHRAFLHADLSNRFFSQTVDGGMLSSSLLLKAPETDSFNRIPILRAGPITALPAGWDAIQGTFAPNFQHLLELRETSSSVMHNNLGTYKRRPESPGRRERDRSATEVQVENQQESEAKTNRATYRMKQWSRMYREIFRRVTDPAALGSLSLEDFTELAVEHGLDLDKTIEAMDTAMPKWREDVVSFYLRILREGVPLSILKDIRWRVSADQSFGAGNRASRLQAIQDLLQIGAGLPRDTVDKLRHAFVVERTGNTDLADEMFPQGRETGDSREFLLVVMENNDMRLGHDIPVPADVDHVKHLESHLQLFYRDVELWREDPNEKNTIELVSLGNALVPHVGTHLEYISRDPIVASRTPDFLEELKRLQAVVREIQAASGNLIRRNQEDRDALAEEIAQLRRMADKTQGDLEIKQREMEGRLQIEAAKTENLNRNRDAKTATQLQTRGVSWQHDEMRKMESHQLEMQKQMDKLMAERERLALENARLRQQIGQSNATPRTGV